MNEVPLGQLKQDESCGTPRPFVDLIVLCNRYSYLELVKKTFAYVLLKSDMLAAVCS